MCGSCHMIMYALCVNILAQRARLWVTPGRGCFAVERVKSEIRIPACQRLREHSPYVQAPACQRHLQRAGQMLAPLAMAGRSKSETNLKFECSNAQNNQENIHFITVNLF